MSRLTASTDPDNAKVNVWINEDEKDILLQIVEDPEFGITGIGGALLLPKESRKIRKMLKRAERKLRYPTE